MLECATHMPKKVELNKHLSRPKKRSERKKEEINKKKEDDKREATNQSNALVIQILN